MTFAWPMDKLAIVNSALVQTGDNLVNAAENGSVEWDVCSAAYETALGYVCESHPWNWLTEWRTLQPSPTAPNDTYFDTAYALPADLVHLIMVRMNNIPRVWDFLNGKLIINAKGGPPAPSVPTTPYPVMIKGIFSTNADAQNATPTVIMVLEMFVMSGIYRGIKKDVGEAGRLFAAAEKMLERAKSRHDMQKPKAAIFNSRMTAVRRNRKPWRQTPNGWSGTGSPN